VRMLGFVCRWPFTMAAVFVLFLEVLARAVHTQYDDRALGGLIFALGTLLGVVFSLPDEILYFYLKDIPRPYDVILNTSAGLLLSILLDILLQLAKTKIQYWSISCGAFLVLKG
jgi:hypothetical protein